jgi:hypothetical protein
MSKSRARMKEALPRLTNLRPDRVASRCVVGVAEGVAVASRTFADELAQDPRLVALPVTGFTATLHANASFLRAMAGLVRDITVDVDLRGHVDDRHFDEVADDLAGHVGTAPDA